MGLRNHVGVLASLLLLGACDDNSRPMTSSDRQVQARLEERSALLRSTTAAELRQANPQAWVGTGHNLILDAFAQQYKRGALRFETACAGVALWMESPDALSEIGDRVTQGIRRSMQSELMRLDVCNPPDEARQSRVNFTPTALAGSGMMSGAAETYLPLIRAEVEEAEDSNDLATRLSWIVAATASMDSADAAGVMALVAVAQDSWEYWQETNSYETSLNDMENTLGECGSDPQMNGYQTEPDINGTIWACDSGFWVASAYRGGRSTGGVILASYSPRSIGTAADCNPPAGWKRDIVDGDLEGAFAGLVVGGAMGAVNGGGAVSAYRSWKYLILHAVCRINAS